MQNTHESNINLEEIEWFFPKMQVARSLMRKGDFVPLHNHGGRYGIVYILSGRCQITNYSVIKKQNSHYVLQLISDREYIDNQFTLISKKNNVHSILALEDTLFLDAFTVKKSREFFQEFLEIIGKAKKPKHALAKVISLQDANISQHLLDKECTQIEINN